MLNKISNDKKAILILLFGFAINQAYAQYQIKRSSINNGGITNTVSHYRINASIGQVDSSNPQAQGGYIITGGFWLQNNIQKTENIFNNGFE